MDFHVQLAGDNPMKNSIYFYMCYEVEYVDLECTMKRSPPPI